MIYAATKNFYSGLGILVVGVALLQNCAGPAHSAEGDVAWFAANPAARQDTMARCRNDARVGRRAVCANAERAESQAFSRRLTRTPAPDGMFESPVVRDALMRACKEPAGRRLAGSRCGRT